MGPEDDGRALAVATRAQERRMAQQRKDAARLARRNQRRRIPLECRRTSQIRKVETRLRARDQEKRSLKIKISCWELSFRWRRVAWKNRGYWDSLNSSREKEAKPAVEKAGGAHHHYPAKERTGGRFKGSEMDDTGGPHPYQTHWGSVMPYMVSKGFTRHRLRANCVAKEISSSSYQVSWWYPPCRASGTGEDCPGDTTRDDERYETMLMRMPSLDWTPHRTSCQRRREKM